MPTVDPKDADGRDNGDPPANGQDAPSGAPNEPGNGGTDSYEANDDLMKEATDSEEEGDSNILVINTDEEKHKKYEYRGDVPPPRRTLSWSTSTSYRHSKRKKH